MIAKIYLTPQAVSKDTKWFMYEKDRLDKINAMNVKRHLIASKVLKDTEKHILVKIQFRCNECIGLFYIPDSLKRHKEVHVNKGRTS